MCLKFMILYNKKYRCIGERLALLIDETTDKNECLSVGFTALYANQTSIVECQYKAGQIIRF